MILFVGSYNNPNSTEFNGSGAGAKVQREIVKALQNIDKEVTALVMPEMPSWPKGNLIVSKEVLDEVVFLPILNISFLKRIVFFIQVFVFFIRYRPSSIFYYNSSVVSCIFSFFIRFFSTSRVVILQDFFAARFDCFNHFFDLRNIISFFHAKLIPYSYDFFIPITASYITELILPEKKSFPFPGAVPYNRIKEFASSNTFVNDYAVFAGALEEYNGVDLLVKNWPHPDVMKFELHIFGSGKLSDFLIGYTILNSNIIYHGHMSPAVVDKYLMQSRINFCFRYSKGIDQNLFFPSKFFDLILLPGYLLCNRFDNIPDDLVDYVVIIDDDLVSIEEFLTNITCADRDFGNLIDIILINYTWQGFIQDFFKRNSF